MRPFVFVRVGQLEHYDRRYDEEGPVGGGAYNVDHDGSEVENFHPVGGVLQGYAQVSSSGGFNSGQINAPVDSHGRINGVLLIMFARSAHGQVIVGWYEDATLMTESQDRTRGREGLFNFTGKVERAVLLPTNARGFAVPKGRNATGQSNVFYPLNKDGSPRNHGWIQRVIRYIETYRGPNMLAGTAAPTGDPENTEGNGVPRCGQGPRIDPDERIALEAESMRQAEAYFRKQGYGVKDTSKTEPYDLLCIGPDGGQFRVEVKGTTTAGLTVELTLNEVESARKNPTALVVVSGLELVGKGAKCRARGGDLRCFTLWSPLDHDLTPTMYRYTVPTVRS